MGRSAALAHRRLGSRGLAMRSGPDMSRTDGLTARAARISARSLRRWSARRPESLGGLAERLGATSGWSRVEGGEQSEGGPRERKSTPHSTFCPRAKAPTGAWCVRAIGHGWLR